MVVERTEPPYFRTCMRVAVRRRRYGGNPAYRGISRHAAGAGAVCVAKPYEVHGEAGGGTWRILYVARSVVAGLTASGTSPACRRRCVRSSGGRDLRALLRGSEAGPSVGTYLPSWHMIGSEASFPAIGQHGPVEPAVAASGRGACSGAPPEPPDRVGEPVRGCHHRRHRRLPPRPVLLRRSRPAAEELSRAGAPGPRQAPSRRGTVRHVGGVRVRLCRSVPLEPTLQGVLRPHARRLPGAVPGDVRSRKRGSSAA